MSGQDRLGPYGFESLGGPVTDMEAAHVTVTFWHADKDVEPHAELTIDGANYASVKLTKAECRRLRNVLAQAERRFG